MARKIPGRKHHGVRDPEKQQAERFRAVQNKINAPPVNPDDQQVPKSAQRIAELRQKVKDGEFRRKKKKKTDDSKNLMPGGFRRRPGETNRDLVRRVNRVCEDLKREHAFEEKYGVEVKRDERGEVEKVVKRPKDPLVVMMKEAKKAKLEKKKKKKKGKQEADSEEGPRLTKSQKRRKKLVEKMNKKSFDKLDEFENYKDEVKFGEQVHAPPTLTVVPRKVKADQNAPRPGRKDLLLKSLLGGKESSKVPSKVIDRKGKRKDLPHALRRQLDKHREEVVQAYKALKAKKL